MDIYNSIVLQDVISINTYKVLRIKYIQLYLLPYRLKMCDINKQTIRRYVDCVFGRSIALIENINARCEKSTINN